jgi:hypothetical protein
LIVSSFIWEGSSSSTMSWHSFSRAWWENWLLALWPPAQGSARGLCWVSHNSVSQSQCYFTTGSLLPISSSWHQAPRGSQLEVPPPPLQVNPWGHSPLCNILSD